jgi:uncharacterized protein YlxW (UPF0749 family)
VTTDAAKKKEALVADIQKKVTSLKGQVEKHEKKLAGKRDERLRMLRRQLKRNQRSFALLTGKYKKKDEKAAG